MHTGGLLFLALTWACTNCPRCGRHKLADTHTSTQAHTHTYADWRNVKILNVYLMTFAFDERNESRQRQRRIIAYFKRPAALINNNASQVCGMPHAARLHFKAAVINGKRQFKCK